MKTTFQDLSDWTQADWTAWVEAGCPIWAPYIPLQTTDAVGSETESSGADEGEEKD